MPLPEYLMYLSSEINRAKSLIVKFKETELPEIEAIKLTPHRYLTLISLELRHLTTGGGRKIIEEVVYTEQQIAEAYAGFSRDQDQRFAKSFYADLVLDAEGTGDA
jgi:hypothetical protein